MKIHFPVEICVDQEGGRCYRWMNPYSCKWSPWFDTMSQVDREIRKWLSTFKRGV